MANPQQYQSGTQAISSLTGNERVAVDSGGAVTATVTTQQIAALAATGTAEIVNTTITTVGNGTLTAAGIVGGLITRTGPTAAYTDTTATAAQIVALLPSFVSGSTFFFSVKNGTQYLQTLQAGNNVTLPTTVIVGPFQVANYFGTVGGTSGSPTVTFTHLGTTAIGEATYLTAPVATALNTVGNGTITAAGINGGATLRGGSQSATPFTDTTDVATAIIAGNPGLVGKIGAAIVYYYINNTNALATIQGTTGITVSQGSLGSTALVPAGMTAGFIITYTATATLTMVCIGVSANTATTTGFAGSSSGETLLAASAVAAGTLTLPPVTGTLASTSGANLYVSDLKRCSATVTSNSTTLANVTGLSFTVVPGTYRVRAALSGVADGTGGIKYALNYTTTVVSVLEITGRGSTAAALATQHSTSTTTQALLFDQAAAVLFVELDGTIVVTTGGTVDIQVAQHATNASSTTVVGSYAEFTRIA
jgi:hypothetical protein